ncbi:DUF5997 family protein [Rhodococcus sp. TAF43]|uniref:DUF5997 family protein n=1 Tax=unclassified Rhodococcus (in: high G+C Gram-positive bacteria) TaxID=192944 RepID=UPI000E0B1A39|nr:MULTISPECIES: DUF5997 family protein [unclassified Rhodococcus (in: high G+C Gram-positive bacteria)]QKT11264.1 hypothetical protein HUN07_11480 [Rhodococcus sp. W8901]RDI31544.1 hypothetical protein DEU38_104258 [Rhodococcus sp. AG1013]
MTSQKTPQTMKPATAAKKLGVYLQATPAEFQDGVVTRDELSEWQTNPPAWLTELRANGPHPRPVVAAKLGVSISGLTRGGIEDALTTEQIEALLADQPDWLVAERANLVEVRKEEKRVKELQAVRREESNRKPRSAGPFKPNA